MIKLLIGGSPCTYWSIAQKNGRETEASGMGWELFLNYLIAKKKFKPDYFLYENNKSAAQPIKDQISRELGVDLMHINSALVSAQNRERFYGFNWEVSQPEDRGIFVRDILESSTNEIIYDLVHRTESRVENGIIRVGDIGSTAQANRVYSCDGKSVTINAGGGGQGGKTGLYACPFELSDEYFKGGIDSSLIGMTTNGEGKYRNGNQPSQQYRVYSCDSKSQVVNTLGNENYVVPSDGKEKPVYEVKNGLITIKDKQYPVNLADGYYIIRKLTVTECCRLQTLPDDYCRAVSNAQAYKGLGNGWTAEVIIHILNGALKDVPRDEELVILSMYDGIGTGRYCLDKMGFTNVRYYAYEIDKYAKQVAMSNYPDIIQCGDAFDLRHPDWTIGY
jgi:DNA (cytosine-5)-methyltransferase 3A